MVRAISHVSQEVTTIDATIGESVALEYKAGQIDSSDIESCQRITKLHELTSSPPDGLDIFVGKMARIDGGARTKTKLFTALLTQPRILVLDKATRSLVNKTGGEMITTLSKLHGETTMLTAAHRMNTSQNADKMGCVRDDEMIATGNYVQISLKFPNSIEASIDYDS